MTKTQLSLFLNVKIVSMDTQTKTVIVCVSGNMQITPIANVTTILLIKMMGRASVRSLLYWLVNRAVVLPGSIWLKDNVRNVRFGVRNVRGQVLRVPSILQDFMVLSLEDLFYC